MKVEVPPGDHAVLASWLRSPSVRAGLARRARIVLLAGDGIGTNEIVRRTGASKPTVIASKKRYGAEGIGGLAKVRDVTGLYLTPISGSWLNMVEVFFSIITRQAIRRGNSTSVPDLINAVEAFIDGWNDRCHPFTWTKTADELLPKCRPGKRTSFTRR